MKVFVEHRGLGCDTGCCGHVVTLEGDDGSLTEDFSFEHPGFNPGESEREFAQRLVTEAFGQEHVADLDWDNVLVLDD